tara:strand:+ start:412 stop:1320 length:909 start_codon:yes stop_codon:yes gene_type:complete
MKSILFILIFFTFFIDVNAANTKLKKYENYSNQITWKGIDINLPKGEWMYFSKETDNLQNFNIGCVRFLKIRNKLIDGSLFACYVTSGGKWRQALGAALKNEWQNNKYDSCNLRPEYFYVKALFKGASSNCFISRHVDPNKELYFPDDPSDKVSGGLKKYIKDRSLKLPKIGLGFESVYFSNKRDKAITISLVINPEAYGAEKTLFETEESSEYHRNNLNNYPLKRNFFSSWTKKMSIEHSILEDQLKASTDFKLDFSDLNASIPNKSSKNLIEDLNKLNELYKSGILNEEEFEKAKKKILN